MSKTNKTKKQILSLETVERRILLIRGHKVMLDVDLAELYGVETRALNQAVKRNINRFPDDFMFQLTRIELDVLLSQIVIANLSAKSRSIPYAFTELGVAMLSSVLSSQKAVEVNMQIMRTFIKLRELIFLNEEVRNKIDQIERKLQDHDSQFEVVFDYIREAIAHPEKEIKIGFVR